MAVQSAVHHTHRAGRREVRFPPAVHMAAVDGADAALDHFLSITELPEGTEMVMPGDNVEMSVELIQPVTSVVRK